MADCGSSGCESTTFTTPFVQKDSVLSDKISGMLGGSTSRLRHCTCPPSQIHCSCRSNVFVSVNQFEQPLVADTSTVLKLALLAPVVLILLFVLLGRKA